MRPYEVTIILDPELDDDAVRAATDRVGELVRSGGGSPGEIRMLGKRRMAYEVDHKADGWYAIMEASAEPTAMADLDRALHLTDEVIRHKVMRVPPGQAGNASSLRVAAAEAATESSTDAHEE